jgi:hypothetical protein
MSLEEEYRIYRELAWSLAHLNMHQLRVLAKLHQQLLHETHRMIDLEDLLEIYAACSIAPRPPEERERNAEPRNT